MATLVGVIVTLVFSWLYMQWTHEAGHIIAGLASGATLEHVSFDPRSFSQTRFSSNPKPLITVWGGPMLGVLIGAGFPLLSACWHQSWRLVFLCIASFILIANGLYIGLGAFTPVGDAETMIRLGTPRWLMIAYGLVCVILGRALLQPVLSGRFSPMSRAQAVQLILMSFVMAVLGLTVYSGP